VDTTYTLAGVEIISTSDTVNEPPQTYAAGATVAANAAGVDIVVNGTGTLYGVTHTGAVIPTVTSVTNGVTVTTNNDKSGYSLTAVTGLGNQTANITGNLSGSVGSVTGAIGSVSAGGIAAGVLTAGAQNEIADAFLDRNIATGTDSGNLAGTIRTTRQALRVLRNKVDLTLSPFEVYKEDDVTVSWTGALTTAAGDPITTVNPTGP